MSIGCRKGIFSGGGPKIPKPDGLWLDASSAATIMKDSPGTIRAAPGDRVLVWKDRSGQGRHVTLGNSTNASHVATWSWNPADMGSANRPMVRFQGDFGLVPQTPLDRAFTVVGVWRYCGETTVGSPACNVGPIARFFASYWIETLGVDYPRQMYDPYGSSGLPHKDGDMVLMMWQRTTTGDVTWRMGALMDENGGATQWTGSGFTNETAFLQRDFRVNSLGCVLVLGELMVWRRAPLSATDRDQVQQYLQRKWRVTIGTAATVTKVIPDFSSLGFALPDGLWLDANLAGSLKMDRDGTTHADYLNTNVAPWFSTDRVCYWNDRSPALNDVVIERADPQFFAKWTRLDDSSGWAIPNTHPMVALLGAWGATKTNPLSTTAFTIVGVWQHLYNHSNTQSCNVDTRARFSEQQWIETIGVDDPRTMYYNLGSDMGYVDGDVIIMMWQRTAAGTLTWRLRSLLDGSTGAMIWQNVTFVNDLQYMSRSFALNSSVCCLNLAELMVWKTAALTTSDMTALQTYLQTKWNVRTFPNVPVSNYYIPQFSSLGFPTPDALWLDAEKGNTMFRDAAATMVAAPNDPILCWKDTSGSGRDLVIVANSGASVQWSWMSPFATSHPRPMVYFNMAYGVTTSNPLSGASRAFTMVAVWRFFGEQSLLEQQACNVDSSAAFYRYRWTETIGVDQPRLMYYSPVDDLGYVDGDVVIMMWQRTAAGTLLWRVRSLLDNNTGAIQWYNTTFANDLAFLTRNFAVSAPNKRLALAEMMVWQTASPLSDEFLGFVQLYLQRKWGVRTFSGATVKHYLPSYSSLGFPSPDGMWLDASVANSVYQDAGGTLNAGMGNYVLLWKDISGKGCNLVVQAVGDPAYYVQYAGGPSYFCTQRFPFVQYNWVNPQQVPLMHFYGAYATAVSNPLKTSFTMVAVWRFFRERSPCSPAVTFDPRARFDRNGWVETVGVDVPHTMEVNPVTDLGFADEEMVLMMWQRTASGELLWSVRALTGDMSGARQWRGSGFELELNFFEYNFTVNAPGCDLALGELMVWQSVLSAEHLSFVELYMQRKWGVLARTGTTTTGTIALSPIGFPVPTGVWLDAAATNTVKSDVDGTLATVVNGSVRRWNDCSGNVNYVLTQASSTGSLPIWSYSYKYGTTVIVSPTSRPLVFFLSSGATFAVEPMALAFTIVGVFRFEALTRPAGQPLNRSTTTQRFYYDQWFDQTGLDVLRYLPCRPNFELEYVSGDMVIMLWQRNASGEVIWRVRSIVPNDTGGVEFRGSNLGSETSWFGQSLRMNALNTTNVPLAELLVWQHADLDADNLSRLQTLMRRKWGLKKYTKPFVQHGIPVPITTIPTFLQFDASNASQGLRNYMTPITTFGQVVTTWWPTDNSLQRYWLQTNGLSVTYEKSQIDGRPCVRNDNWQNLNLAYSYCSFWGTTIPSVLPYCARDTNFSIALVYVTSLTADPLSGGNVRSLISTTLRTSGFMLLYERPCLQP